MSITAKIVLILGAVLSIAAGIIAFCFPGATLGGAAVFIGIVLICMGASMIASYIMERNYMLGSMWVLIGGIATIVLGIFAIINTSLVASTLPVLFAIWALCTGVARLMTSFDLKHLNFSNWWISTIVGALLIVFAIISFFDPVLSAIAMTTLIGLYLVGNGIYSFFELYYINKFETTAQAYLNKLHSIVVEPIEVKKDEEK